MRIHTFVLPEPFSIGHVNVYLVETDRLTLIDSGPKTSEAEERLMAYLTGLNYKVTDISQIILTHCHPDHTGLSRTLGKLAGAEVWVHPAELESEIQVQTKGLGLSGAELFLSAGLSKAELQQVEVNYHKLYDSSCQQHAWLAHGDSIPIGQGFELRVIHTPGHTLGHSCFYEPQTQVLFSGDQLLEKMLPLPSLEIDTQGKRLNMMNYYLKSLQTIVELKPKTVLPGHGAMITDVTGVVEDIWQHMELRKTEILSLIDETATVMDLVRGLYPGIKGLDIVPAVAKVWGFLDLLEDEGLIQWQIKAGVIHYNKSSR